MPAEVEGGWRRGPVTEQAAGEAPKLARELGMDRVFAASYSGPGEIDATLFRMRTPEVAFELAQKWPPSPDSVSIYEKCDFVTVRWRAAEREVARNFVRALARRLKSMPD